MVGAVPLAWLQLSREKVRLLVALAGVGFAVFLILMQLGFQEALYVSAVRYHRSLDFDLAMISPKTDFIVQAHTFTQRRLYQVLGYPEVEEIKPVYLSQALWRNPDSPTETRTIFVVGFDPSDRIFAMDSIAAQAPRLRIPDVAIYDALSRPEFGPVAERVRAGERVETEVVNRRIEVVGLFELGTSFGVDAALLTSDLNFLRLFPERRPGLVELGLVDLVDGSDPDRVRETLEAELPGDVTVLTRAQFIEREIDYWRRNTAIGFIFGFGAIVGLLVGGIIVYQILFADVSDHLNEYATLKAMGYSNRYLFGVVFQESAILAVLGFLPGFLAVAVSR